MELKQSLISSDRYSIKCPYSMEPWGVCIHNTDNNAPAKNEIAYMKRNDNQVSFHIAVDNEEAIQAIPFNRNAWHSGDGGRGNGNRHYIAVEICYSASGGSRFEQAENNAVQVVGDILKRYGWGVDHIKAHRDFSNKNCPSRTNMQSFISKVASYIGNNTTPSTQPSSGYSVGDKVKVVGNNYATGQHIPDWVKQNTYKIIQVGSGKVLLDDIMSWVYTSDITKQGGGTIGVGSRVKVTGNKYATGQNIPSWVKDETYTVMQMASDRALLKEIMSWVYLNDLVLV